MQRFVTWLIGFVVLFLINVFVEAVLLPLWGLENTSKNDIYFQSWWLVVGFWALFGLSLLAVFERPTVVKP